MPRFAAFCAQARASDLPALFAVSGTAYLALIAQQQGGHIAQLCGEVSLSELWHLIFAAPWLLSPGQLAFEWCLMVIAMMTPLIAPMLAYVRRTVFSELRKGAMAAFIFAYWATWCASIVVLFPLAVAVSALVGVYTDLLITLVLALIYSASPLAQRARNACHQAIRIEPFGTGAWLDSAKQGVVTGLRCIAACWPWMLVPFAIVTGHTIAMVIVGLYLFAERIAPPTRPTWQLPPAIETIFGPLVRRSEPLRKRNLNCFDKPGRGAA
jgi:predicted metal-binding membrane protein